MITRQFASSAIRIVTGEGGPWFVMEDVCSALRIFEPKADIDNGFELEDHEKTAATLPTPAGQRPFIVVNLSGIHTLVEFATAWTNDPDDPLAFMRWVTTEIVSLLTQCGPVLLPPGPQERLYSTTDLAQRLGLRPNVLGKKAKSLKRAEYGEWRPAVGLHSERPVEQWWWNAAGQGL
jgi:prophage antirepressor-like protein